MKWVICLFIIASPIYAQHLPFDLKFQTPIEKAHQILSTNENCIGSNDLLIGYQYNYNEYLGEEVKDISIIGRDGVVGYLSIAFNVTPQSIQSVHRRIKQKISDFNYEHDTTNKDTHSITDSWSYYTEFNYLQVVLTKANEFSPDSCKITLTYWYEPKSYTCFIEDDNIFGLNFAYNKFLIHKDIDRLQLYYDERVMNDKVYTIVGTGSICDNNVNGLVLINFDDIGILDHIIIKFSNDMEHYLFRLLKTRYDRWHGQGDKESEKKYLWIVDSIGYKYGISMEQTEPNGIFIYYHFL
jgi:hypothetical protein